MGKYKTEAARFLSGKKSWYFVFTERGYLLAVGNEFTVFVDDETGKTRFFPDMGGYHFSRKERLDAQIEKL